MAVVIEVLSLVLRVDRVAQRFPGGWTAFESQVRDHPSYCNDGELARLAFLTQEDVAALAGDLRGSGLQAEDMAVVDQDTGPVQPPEWLEFYHVDMATDGPKRPVPVVRLKGSTQTRTVFPKGWSWETSSFARGRP